MAQPLPTTTVWLHTLLSLFPFLTCPEVQMSPLVAAAGTQELCSACLRPFGLFSLPSTTCQPASVSFLNISGPAPARLNPYLPTSRCLSVAVTDSFPSLPPPLGSVGARGIHGRHEPLHHPQRKGPGARGRRAHPFGVRTRGSEAALNLSLGPGCLGTTWMFESTTWPTRMIFNCQ